MLSAPRAPTPIDNDLQELYNEVWAGFNSQDDDGTGTAMTSRTAASTATTSSTSGYGHHGHSHTMHHPSLNTADSSINGGWGYSPISALLPYNSLFNSNQLILIIMNMIGPGGETASIHARSPSTSSPTGLRRTLPTAPGPASPHSRHASSNDLRRDASILSTSSSTSSSRPSYVSSGESYASSSTGHTSIHSPGGASGLLRKATGNSRRELPRPPMNPRPSTASSDSEGFGTATRGQINRNYSFAPSVASERSSSSQSLSYSPYSQQAPNQPLHSQGQNQKTYEYQYVDAEDYANGYGSYFANATSPNSYYPNANGNNIQPDYELDSPAAASPSVQLTRRPSDVLRDLAAPSSSRFDQFSDIPQQQSDLYWQNPNDYGYPDYGGGGEYGSGDGEYEDDAYLEESFINLSLLSHLAVQLRDKVPRDTHVKGSIPYERAFTGKDIVNTIQSLLAKELALNAVYDPSTVDGSPTTSAAAAAAAQDRRVALQVAQSLQSQLFFYEVEWGGRALQDGVEDVYMFIDDNEPGGSSSTGRDELSGLGLKEELPTGVVTMLTKCYSPTCGESDRPCYSFVCPRKVSALCAVERKERY
jgi:RHO1 GDP-GTP exchange protein 1/2